MRDFRGYLSELESLEHMVEVNRSVALRHELCAIQWRIEREQMKAVMFARNDRGPRRVAGNLFLAPLRTGIQPTVPFSPELLGLVSGLRKPGIVYPLWATNDMFLQAYQELEQTVVGGLEKRRAPVVVAAHWPHNYEGSKVRLSEQVPAPWYFKEDAGHYLSAAVTIVRDPETGYINAGIYRIQVLDDKRLGIMVNAKRDMLGIIQRTARTGKPVEVAIVVGVAPEMLVAATMSVPYGTSEYDVAGGLAGEAYPISEAKCAELLVPSDAEYLIEGTIDPNVRVMEGPYTEYDLIASQVTEGFCIEVKAVRTKEDPIFHSLVCTSLEMISLIMPLGMTELAKTRTFIKQISPNVKDLFMLPGVPGTGLAVSLYKQSEAEPLDVLRALFAFSARLKRIVIVDDDIDIYDPYDVQWAVDTRVRATQDIMVLEATGEYTDAARVGDFSVKMGIDATRKRAHGHRLLRSDLSFMDGFDLGSYVR